MDCEATPLSLNASNDPVLTVSIHLVSANAAHEVGPDEILRSIWQWAVPSMLAGSAARASTVWTIEPVDTLWARHAENPNMAGAHLRTRKPCVHDLQIVACHCLLLLLVIKCIGCDACAWHAMFPCVWAPCMTLKCFV